MTSFTANRLPEKSLARPIQIVDWSILEKSFQVDCEVEGVKDRLHERNAEDGCRRNRAPAIGGNRDDEFIARVNQRKLRFLGPVCREAQPRKTRSENRDPEVVPEKGFC